MAALLSIIIPLPIYDMAVCKLVLKRFSQKFKETLVYFVFPACRRWEIRNKSVIF